MLGKALGSVVLELLALLFLSLEGLARIDVVIHVVLALEARELEVLLLIGLRREVIARAALAAADGGRMHVDQVVDGHAAVQKGLDFVLAVLLGIAAQPGPVVGHLVHHLAVGVGEVGIVFEEIAVAVNMRHDQLLIERVVAAH